MTAPTQIGGRKKSRVNLSFLKFLARMLEQGSKSCFTHQSFFSCQVIHHIYIYLYCRYKNLADLSAFAKSRERYGSERWLPYRYACKDGLVVRILHL